MDILNWFYLRKERLIKKTANNPEKDLIAIGADVTFAKRDDRYKTYAMPIKNLSVAGDAANTGYYTVDLSVTSIVDVTTQKGVIEIIMDNSIAEPLPAFGAPVPLVIANADMDFSNADNVYIQNSVYYNPAISDTFIPYVISTGVVPTGATFAIFNANPSLAGSLLTFAVTGSTTRPLEAGNSYTGVASSGSPTGSNATFTVTRNAITGAVDTVTIVNAGQAYEPGDVLTILGSLVGGADGVDNITLQVSTTTAQNQFEGSFYLYYELYNF
jgi:hypothetical protein